MKRPRTRRTSRSAPNPTITLLTDFGTADQYVGVIKGVLRGICPRARVIDLSHDVKPQAIVQGSFLLWASYRYFPQGTIFLAVVDPGVGTDRKILIATTAGKTFIAPDNGLLDPILSDEKVYRAYELSAEDIDRLRSRRILPATESTTFDGRDVFAPLAAQLAAGKKPSRLGRLVGRALPAQFFSTPAESPEEGIVLHVDHFGNVVLNLRSSDASNDRLDSVEAGNRRVNSRITSYMEAPEGEPCLVVGSSGLLEISVRGESAAAALNLQVGDSVRFGWKR